MTPDIVKTIAHHRWHALAALIVVVTVHGWLLNGLPPTSRWLSGSISGSVIRELSLTCTPQYQYTSPQGDAVVAAGGGMGDYEWDVGDADELHVSDNTAVIRYRTPYTSTHIVVVRNRDEQAECLVIIP